MSSSNETPAAATMKHPYRDPSLSISARVSDLLSRMTLPEKAGQLFHNMIAPGPGGALADANPVFHLASTETSLGTQHISHFNLLGPVTDVKMVAEWHNRLQRRAAETRLGIPVTLSTDPRNHFTDNVGTSFRAGLFSQWPETLGFAALRDGELVRRFGDVARQEYVALGLRVALHPQIDLSTEPRWARINATFGEDAELSGELGAAYIRGFQGEELGAESVATMTKHFPGGGPQMDGEDPHFDYGREQVYPGDNLEYHLKPFEKAIAAGTSQMMPYYGMPIKDGMEPVGFGFNKGVITGLLRERFGFQGIVCTDWGLISDASIMGQNMPARAWGVEHLSEIERVKKVLDAGCDQFGGESRPELVIELVEKGQVSEARIDESVSRLLHEKFLLGLFDKPYIDVEAAEGVIGKAEFVREGEIAQRRSYTLLKNKDGLLPLQKTEGRKVYVENIASDPLSAQGLSVVDSPAAADLAIIRLRAPYEPRSGGFEAHFHAGSLAYPAAEIARQAAIFAAVPTIVDLYVDRPAVIPEIAEGATALLVNYGASAAALLDVLFGDAKPEGKLPFDLPRSMEAVKAGKEDVPFDTVDPVYKFGDGLGY